MARLCLIMTLLCVVLAVSTAFQSFPRRSSRFSRTLKFAQDDEVRSDLIDQPFVEWSRKVSEASRRGDNKMIREGDSYVRNTEKFIGKKETLLLSSFFFL